MKCEIFTGVIILTFSDLNMNLAFFSWFFVVDFFPPQYLSFVEKIKWSLSISILKLLELQ